MPEFEARIMGTIWKLGVAVGRPVNEGYEARELRVEGLLVEVVR